jgi:hypothetical protein
LKTRMWLEIKLSKTLRLFLLPSVGGGAKMSIIID